MLDVAGIDMAGTAAVSSSSLDSISFKCKFKFFNNHRINPLTVRFLFCSFSIGGSEAGSVSDARLFVILTDSLITTPFQRDCFGGRELARRGSVDSLFLFFRQVLLWPVFVSRTAALFSVCLLCAGVRVCLWNRQCNPNPLCECDS